jgi:hypothetical protein
VLKITTHAEEKIDASSIFLKVCNLANIRRTTRSSDRLVIPCRRFNGHAVSRPSSDYIAVALPERSK